MTRVLHPSRGNDERRRTLGALLLASLVAVGCGGPLGPFAGGRLSGNEQKPPSDWAFTTDVMVVQLETRPEDPYSVNLGCIAHGGSVYVGTDHPDSARWVAHIEADPRVRLRVGDAVYDRTAVRVTDVAEYNLAGIALFEKYDLDRDDRGHGRLFRLDPR